MKSTTLLVTGLLGALSLAACTQQPVVPATAQASASTTKNPGPPRPAGGHGREAFIGSYDVNGDGVVTRAEYDAVRLARFRAADTNNDGVLSEAEYVAEFEGRLKRQYSDQGREPDDAYRNSIRQAHVRFALLDRNRDGVLSMEEELLIADKTFKGQDTNNDGKVDANDPLPQRNAPSRNNDAD